MRYYRFSTDRRTTLSAGGSKLPIEREVHRIFPLIRELGKGIHRGVERIVDKSVDNSCNSSDVTILYRFA
jgi:hypothetical protein